MKAIVERLVDVVERLLEEHRGLLEAGRRQREALVAGDIEALDAAVREVDERAKRIARWERRRQEIGAELADRLGIPREALRLSEIARRVDPATARRMEALSAEFDRVLAELRKVNEQNRALTEQSLTYVRQMIDMLTEVRDPGVYGPARPAGPAAGAPVSPAGGARMFDARA